MAHVHAQKRIQQLADLQPDPSNANRGTVRGQQLLAASLKKHGAGRSILADRNGVVIAGSKTLQEAKTLGLKVRVIETTGEELVVVQRTNLDLATDPTAKELALADNRIAELNLEWDPTLLEGFAASGLDLDAFWTPTELERIVGHGLHAGQTADDAVVPIRPTSIQPGDLFELGAHRVLCGDACDGAAVGRLFGDDQPVLMVTDPPYGVSYDPAWRVRAGRRGQHKVGRVTNDDQVDWAGAFTFFPGPVMYVWHAGLHSGTVAASLTACGFDLRAQVIWVKPHFVLGRGDLHWQHEPCWYAVRSGQSSHWCGSRTESTVWSVPNLNPFQGGHTTEDALTAHATQKPVALYERAFLYNSVSGDVVYDPFLGSGTAIIAAQKTGRRCLGLELEPPYVQMIIDRWEVYSGARARKVDAVATPTMGQ